VLATDIRFASEQAILGQFEIGAGTVPGGGLMARLGRLVGRGRALEILLGGDDVPAALAADYGYVNRLVPDVRIEEFTDAFARRIASFEKAAVTGIKQLVDAATLPDDEEFAHGLRAYSPRPAGRRTARSSGCSSTGDCSSRAASRPTWAPKSEGYARRPDRPYQ
jgi:enoyl-CoA hydratase/carnithine racemase